MLERTLYADLVRGALAEGWLLWRLPDAPGLPPRPADLAGCDPAGRFCLVEVKVCRSKKGFRGLAGLEFEDSQVRWLRACAARGGLALVAVKEEGLGRARMLLVRVFGQGPDDRADDRAWGGRGGGGLVSAGVAELKRGRAGEWRGWADTVRGWEVED